MKDAIKEAKQFNEEQNSMELTPEVLEQIAGGAADKGKEEEQKRLVTRRRKQENRRKALRQFAKIVRREV